MVPGSPAGSAEPPMMSPPPPTPQANRALYDELAQWLSGRLRTPLKALFDTVDDSLFELAEHSVAGEMQQRYFDGMRECRRRRLQVEQRFAQAVAEGALLPVDRQAGHQDGLSLVGHEELEEELAITAMASKAQQRHGNALYALTRRLAVVLGEDDLPEERNPFGPLTLAECFREASAELDLSLDVRLIVLKLFERHVLGTLEPLYTEINIRLADAGILPTLTPRLRRDGGTRSRPAPPTSPPPAAPRADAPAAPADSDRPADAGHDMVREVADAVFQALLERMPQGDRPGQEDPPVNPAGDAGAATASAVDEAVERAAARAFGGAELPPPRQLAAQLLAEARYGGSGQPPPRPQVATVDMLGRLFEVLLADRRVPTPLQPLFQRLQLPVTRAALGDADEISQANGSARRLLELFGQTALGWCPSADPQRRLLSQLQEFVDSLGDARSAEERTRLVERLRSALDVQQRRAELAEQRVVEAAAGRERLAHARRLVQQTLRERMDQTATPPWVRHLLLRPWANCMVLLWLRQGGDSQAYRESLAFADTVIWCAGAGGTDVEKLRLRALMPVLDGQLRHGLATVAYHDSEIETLAEQLGALIRWRMDETPPPDFLQREPATQPGGDALEEVQADQPMPDEIDAALLKRLRETPPGTWFEFAPGTETARNGDPERAKLSWVSPYSGRCLFVNRNGMRVADRRAEDVVRELEQGMARILESASLLQDAMNAVLEQLRGKPGTERRAAGED